jgi:hypothetical protein
MKRKIIVALIAISMMLVTTTTMAVKPTGAGAENVPWNLSGAVMPSPPWGLSDIPGSDSASKLIVNQPNGNVEVTVTGVMNGLNPNTVYTVYPSNKWLTSEKWNIVGVWSLRFLLGSGIYDHEMTVTFQNMHTGVFSGTGVSTTQSVVKNWDIQGTSKVVGNAITLDLIYTNAGAGYTVHAIGTIDVNGYIVSGTWTSSAGQSGTWTSFVGQATEETVGNGWPGLFNNLETFTFTTDEFGAGSWHFNLKNDDFPEPGDYTLSVWINKGSTILISNNFEVVVD